MGLVWHVCKTFTRILPPQQAEAASKAAKALKTVSFCSRDFVLICKMAKKNFANQTVSLDGQIN
jgi:hypothetical protein